jgi:O-antigen/teichoic acid export membrane protein
MNTVQRLLSNTFLAFAGSVIVKASNSLLFIFIGRNLGPADAGVFNLGITYFTIAFGLSAWGLQELLVREVAPRREKSGHYFTNYLAIRLLLTILTYAVFLLILYLFLPYSAQTKAIIGILTLAVFPEAIFSLCQSLFEAHEQLRVPFSAAVVNSVFKLSGGMWLLQAGYGVEQIAWMVPIGSSLSLLVFVPALVRLFRNIPQHLAARLQIPFIVTQLRLIPSFFAIHLFSLIDYQTDTFMISILLTETHVGWYGAAQTILLAFWIMPVAIRAAIYPVMARYHVQSPEKLATLRYKVNQYIVIIVLPMVTGVYLLAGPIIRLIFGVSFAPAIPVLEWSIWGVVFVFLNVPNARLMLIHQRQKALGWLTGLSMITNVGLNLLLIPMYGIVGAAMARLFASFVFFLSIHFYVHFRLSGARLWRIFPRPLLATLLMALVVWPLRDLTIIWPILAGLLAYGLVSLVLGVVPAQDWVYWRQIYSADK